jgi:hypothetical protein
MDRHVASLLAMTNKRGSSLFPPDGSALVQALAMTDEIQFAAWLRNAFMNVMMPVSTYSIGSNPLNTMWNASASLS